SAAAAVMATTPLPHSIALRSRSLRISAIAPPACARGEKKPRGDRCGRTGVRWPDLAARYREHTEVAGEAGRARTARPGDLDALALAQLGELEGSGFVAEQEEGHLSRERPAVSPIPERCDDPPRGNVYQGKAVRGRQAVLAPPEDSERRRHLAPYVRVPGFQGHPEAPQVPSQRQRSPGTGPSPQIRVRGVGEPGSGARVAFRFRRPLPADRLLDRPADVERGHLHAPGSSLLGVFRWKYRRM